MTIEEAVDGAIQDWVDTYNDEKNFPREEFKEMWEMMAILEPLRRTKKIKSIEFEDISNGN